MLYKNACLLIIVVFLSACCGAPHHTACADSFNFKLLDKISGLPIQINDNLLYEKVKDTGVVGWAVIWPKNAGYIAEPGFTSDSAFLRISSTDIDTLVMSWNHSSTNCCPNYGHLDALKYNGEIATFQNNSFILLK